MEDDFAARLKRALSARASQNDALAAFFSELQAVAHPALGHAAPGDADVMDALLRAWGVPVAPAQGTWPEGSFDGAGWPDQMPGTTAGIVYRHEGGPAEVPIVAHVMQMRVDDARYTVPHDGPPATVPKASCVHRALEGIAYPTADDIARAMQACRDGRD